jgi:diguanylate cyclase (GGDEF)-like protein
VLKPPKPEPLIPDFQAGTSAAVPAGPATAWLPGWILDLQCIDFLPLRRRVIDQTPARLGYGAGILILPDAQGRWTMAESIGVSTMRAGRLAADLIPRIDLLIGTGLERLRGGDWRFIGDGDCESLAPTELLLRLHNGQATCGALWLGKPAGTHSVLRPEELGLLARFLGVQLDLSRQHDRVCNEACSDGLTGLYNYRWMKDALRAELRRAERFGTPLSVLMVDLDGLKAVNDTHGHPVGDAAIRAAALRIGASLRQFDSAARVGGDEFVILLPATEMSGATRVARRLLNRLSASPAVDGISPPVLSASIGIAQSRPSISAEELLAAADRAMYAAKSGGGGRVEIADSHTKTDCAAIPTSNAAP